MKIKIPTINNDPFVLNAEPNGSCVLLGANGSGKTRLSIHLSKQIPQIIQNKNNYVSAIKRYEEEIEQWENKSDKEIKQQFDNYNKQTYTIANRQILNLYQFAEWGLKNGLFNQFENNTVITTNGSFLPHSLSHIQGGTIGCNDLQLKLTIDVDLLKFSENYKTNKNAIKDYKKHKISIAKNRLLDEKKKLGDLGQGFLERTFRISAHRSLNLNTNLSPDRYENLISRFESDSSKFKNNKPVTGLQDDFDILIQTLYSEEADISSKFAQGIRQGNTNQKVPESSLSKLINYWNKIMPHRAIKLNGLKISVKSLQKSEKEDTYDPAEMSDGERNIFYVLGQCLLAPKNSFLIVDEPELHIHKAIMIALWQFIQQQRYDCFFLFVSHDIDFVTSLFWR